MVSRVIDIGCRACEKIDNFKKESTNCLPFVMTTALSLYDKIKLFKKTFLIKGNRPLANCCNKVKTKEKSENVQWVTSCACQQLQWLPASIQRYKAFKTGLAISLDFPHYIDMWGVL